MLAIVMKPAAASIDHVRASWNWLTRGAHRSVWKSEIGDIVLIASVIARCVFQHLVLSFKIPFYTIVISSQKSLADELTLNRSRRCGH